MSTLNASIIWRRRPRPAQHRAWPLAVPLLLAGGLVAGCGSAASGTAGAPASSGPAQSGTATGSAVHSSSPATPIAPGTPVPTVSGGPAAAGGVACVGWPTGAASGALPASFVPVSAERCVNGVTAIPGKGLWTTATLQRSTSDLSGLVGALRHPSATHKPGTVCPALAVMPPQVVLINAAGEKLIPRIPLGDCGLPAAQVLTALNQLNWQPVSIRMIAPVHGATATMPAATGTAPRSAQPPGGGHAQPQGKRS